MLIYEKKTKFDTFFIKKYKGDLIELLTKAEEEKKKSNFTHYEIMCIYYEHRDAFEYSLTFYYDYINENHKKEY